MSSILVGSTIKANTDLTVLAFLYIKKGGGDCSPPPFLPSIKISRFANRLQNGFHLNFVCFAQSKLSRLARYNRLWKFLDYRA